MMHLYFPQLFKQNSLSLSQGDAASEDATKKLKSSNGAEAEKEENGAGAEEEENGEAYFLSTGDLAHGNILKQTSIRIGRQSRFGNIVQVCDWFE